MRAKSSFASGPGKYNDALQDLNKAISLEEDYVNISAYELRSKIRNKRGDFSGAISDLSQSSTHQNPPKKLNTTSSVH